MKQVIQPTSKLWGNSSSVAKFKKNYTAF